VKIPKNREEKLSLLEELKRDREKMDKEYKLVQKKG